MPTLLAPLAGALLLFEPAAGSGQETTDPVSRILRKQDYGYCGKIREENYKLSCIADRLTQEAAEITRKHAELFSRDPVGYSNAYTNPRTGVKADYDRGLQIWSDAQLLRTAICFQLSESESKECLIAVADAWEALFGGTD